MELNNLRSQVDSIDDELVAKLANEKKSNRFGEKGITIGGLANFAIKSESADAAEDTLEEGYSKLITHYSFAKSVLILLLTDDGALHDIKIVIPYLSQSLEIGGSSSLNI